jgi:hypothetical protein
MDWFLASAAQCAQVTGGRSWADDIEPAQILIFDEERLEARCTSGRRCSTWFGCSW